jgi:polar amino acid transport system substrate-binding protein
MTALPRRAAWALAAVAGCAAAAAMARAFGDRSLARLRAGEPLRVGYAVEAPYAFVAADGTVTGEAPELARRIAAQLGVARVEWHQSDFGALLEELQQGRVDVIAAGMFVTPERIRRVSFSIPTFRVRQGLLVCKGNPAALHSYQDAVSSPSVKLAVIQGSVEERLLGAMGLPEARMLRVPDAAAGQQAVRSGLAAGLALSGPTVRWMAMRSSGGELEAAEPFAQPAEGLAQGLGSGAMAFRKEDRRLLEAWNARLGALLGSAEHRALVGSFGFTAADAPAVLAHGAARP